MSPEILVAIGIFIGVPLLIGVFKKSSVVELARPGRSADRPGLGEPWGASLGR